MGSGGLGGPKCVCSYAALDVLHETQRVTRPMRPGTEWRRRDRCPVPRRNCPALGERPFIHRETSAQPLRWRAMRRGGLIAASVAALVALAAAAGAWAGGSLVRVASGRWDGLAWTFAASDQVSGPSVNYCWNMSFATGRGGSGGCSQYIGEANPQLRLPYYGMDVGEALGGCPGLDYVDGPVAASASSVEITLSIGGAIHTSTIAAPAGLARSVRFFVAQIPCGTQPETATARNRAGKVVARSY